MKSVTLMTIIVTIPIFLYSFFSFIIDVIKSKESAEI